MFDKKAFSNDSGTIAVALYPDKEEYRRLYLKGIYEPLRKQYDTEVPFFLWGSMREALNDRFENDL